MIGSPPPLPNAGVHGVSGANGVARGSPVGTASHGENGHAGSVAPPSNFAPPTWPRTAKPLTVAIIGWARLSSQGREGSGYNLNASELARGLAMSGHRVVYLASGMTYRWGLLGPGKTRIAKRERWGEVDCYEVRNSPNPSPGAFNFRNMASEMSSPAQTRLVLAWLDAVGADVVHVHSLEGYGLDMIAAVERSGRPVVLTLHNYWFVCPQVDLLAKEKSVCTDYEGGRACVGCLPGRNVRTLRRSRAFGQTLEHWLGMYPADVIRKVCYGVKPLVAALVKGTLHRRYVEPMFNPERLADTEVAWGFRVPMDGTGAHESLIEHGLKLDKDEAPKDYAGSPADQNERVLNNRDRHLVVLNEYGKRRQAGVAALAAASMVTPPSDYLRKVHVAMGVPEEKTRWVRLGQPHFDQINRRARRSPYYDVQPWNPAMGRPLRLGFFGTVRPNKGLEVLVRAIPLLASDVRTRCQFHIQAQGHDWPFRKRLAKFPEVNVRGGYDLYQLIAAGGEYDVGILSHIWLENSPLVLLENFHAGKFVICSRLGGPVDWIREPEAGRLGNGLFFPGGDERALASCITKIVTGEVTLPTPRQVHEMTTLQSYPDHVREVDGIYQAVVGARSRARM